MLTAQEARLKLTMVHTKEQLLELIRNIDWKVQWLRDGPI